MPPNPANPQTFPTHPAPRPARARVALAAVLTTFIGACAVPGPKVDPVYLTNIKDTPSETRTEVEGDWDDLTAALGVGLGKLNLAVVDSATPGPGEVRLDLVDVLDRSAFLRVRRLVGAGPARVEIAAAFLGERDPGRERLLVGAVAQRFGELRGVEIAPAR